MKFPYMVLALWAVLGAAQANPSADVRNPFDPSGVKANPSTSARAMVLPPPLPPSPALPALPPQEAPRSVPADSPKSAPAESTGRKKAKESSMSIAAAGCKLKAKSESLAAPAYGGLVVISLDGGTRDCVSAVMVEEHWLEVKELSDPSAIRLAVDANDSSTPRQSNIVIANAGRSVTVTLVQEGRAPRNR